MSATERSPLDQPLEDRVEHRIGRQAVLVLLVGAQLGRLGGLSITRGGITSPAGPFIHGRWFSLRQRQVANTRVL